MPLDDKAMQGLLDSINRGQVTRWPQGQWWNSYTPKEKIVLVLAGRVPPGNWSNQAERYNKPPLLVTPPGNPQDRIEAYSRRCLSEN